MQAGLSVLPVRRGWSLWREGERDISLIETEMHCVTCYKERASLCISVRVSTLEWARSGKSAMAIKALYPRYPCCTVQRQPAVILGDLPIREFASFLPRGRPSVRELPCRLNRIFRSYVERKQRGRGRQQGQGQGITTFIAWMLARSRT
jgi:hypothetical protein